MNTITILSTTGMLGLLFLLNFNIKKEREFLILMVANGLSMTITMLQHSGFGCAAITVNLFLCFFIFNNVEITAGKKAMVHLPVAIVLTYIVATMQYNEELLFYFDVCGNKVNSNMYGMYIGLTLMHWMCVINQIGSTRKKELIKIAALAGLCYLFFPMLNASGCRSAMLMVALFLLLFFVVRWKVSYFFYKGVSMLLLIASFVFPSVYLLVYCNIDNFELIGKSFFSGRQTVWLYVMEAILKHPVFGGGTDYLDALAISIGTDSPHHMLLGEWSVLGMLPTATLCVLIVNNSSMKERTNPDRVSMLAFCSTLVLTFFESSYTESYLYMLMTPFLLSNITEKKYFGERMEDKPVRKEESDEIPKVIHYCWFGHAKLPRLAKKCIESWKNYCPDYEIIEWNETNFDYTSCAYAKEAYESKKWAFVSDYARFKILYEHGGIYLDTDVELVKPLDDLLSYGGYIGLEEEGVNPGLGMAAKAGNHLMGEFVSDYEKRHFENQVESSMITTVVHYTTEKLLQKGLQLPVQEPQTIEGMIIYPKDYFGAYDIHSGRITRTEHTYSIHHYAASWCDKKSVFHGKVARILYRMGGEKIVKKLSRK